MKRRLMLPLPLLAALPAARAETAVGGHGMAVFGGRVGLYASHLPMFHTPHDSQIVLRFRLADTAALNLGSLGLDPLKAALARL